MTQNPPRFTLPKNGRTGSLACRQENAALRCRLWTLLASCLERIPQRELDQARLAVSADDFAERRVGRSDGLHVGDGGIGEVGMVPEVKEVRGEAQILAFG